MLPESSQIKNRAGVIVNPLISAIAKPKKETEMSIVILDIDVLQISKNVKCNNNTII
jgi:hypothetical protein